MIRHPLENQAEQYTDAKPCLDHGHDGVIVPCYESYIGLQMISFENVGDNDILVFLSRRKCSRHRTSIGNILRFASG